MKTNNGFLNDLIDNATRMNAFASTTERVGEFLDQIHMVLDQELGISH